MTPAIAKRDNVDFMVLPNWKVYMIQFLNIAGTGPIFGAIMGAKADPEHWTDHIFPALFITVACGAVSGFHATQSPLMGRCLKTERMGRRVFYGAMVTEGLVALIWATIGMWFFYATPTPGYDLIEGSNGFSTSAPAVVHLVSRDWLGAFGAVLAMLGVVAAPITSGDTAFRSSRLIAAKSSPSSVPLARAKARSCDA